MADTLSVREHNDSYVFFWKKKKCAIKQCTETWFSALSWWMIFGSQISTTWAYQIKKKKYTKPPTALGFWIALEECTETNGALYFWPGSHLVSPITKRLVRLPDNKGTGFEPLSHTPMEDKKSLDDDYVLVTCDPGRFLPFFFFFCFAVLSTNFLPCCHHRWSCPHPWSCVA